MFWWKHEEYSFNYYDYNNSKKNNSVSFMLGIINAVGKMMLNLLEMGKIEKKKKLAIDIARIYDEWNIDIFSENRNLHAINNEIKSIRNLNDLEINTKNKSEQNGKSKWIIHFTECTTHMNERNAFLNKWQFCDWK